MGMDHSDLETALNRLKQHLGTQLKSKAREDSFDMDDAPEAKVLSPFTKFQTELKWLDEQVVQVWLDSENHAKSSHSSHWWLAGIAIGTGTVAIVLSIIHLTLKAIKETSPNWVVAAGVTAVLEGVAVG